MTPSSNLRAASGDARYAYVPAWMFDSGLVGGITHAELRLLLVLLRHANPKGQAYPSRERICKVAKLSRGRFAEVYARLEGRGVVRRHRFRKGGERWARWHYTVALRGP